MHPARLSFLGHKHAQWRAVVVRDVRADGTYLSLECGHESVVAPHFDTKHTERVRCRECGDQYVKTAPQYADEFAATAV